MIVHLFGSSVRDYLGTTEATIQWHRNAFWRWFDLKLDVGDHRVQTIYVRNNDLEHALPRNARVHFGQKIDTARQTDIFTTEPVLGEFTRFSAHWLLRGWVHLVVDY
jgi:hypothetical protein